MSYEKYGGNPESVDEFFKIVLGVLNTCKRGNLLDAGTGTGKLACELKKTGFAVRACDIDTTHFLQNDIPIDKVDLNYKLPYPNSSFEYITALELIEHLENPWNFIREMHRILNAKGILILSSPNMESLRGKINFLLGKPFPFFKYYRFKEIYHVTPIFVWNLKRMITNKFNLIDIKYKPHKIPKTNIKIGLNHSLFAENNIFILERLPD